MRSGSDVLMVTTGIMLQRACAPPICSPRAASVPASSHVHTVKPLDIDALMAVAGAVQLMVTIEEHTLVGGLGSAIAELFADRGGAPPLLRLGIPDVFTKIYGTQDDHLQAFGLDPEPITASVADAFGARARR